MGPASSALWQQKEAYRLRWRRLLRSRGSPSRRIVEMRRAFQMLAVGSESRTRMSARRAGLGEGVDGAVPCSGAAVGQHGTGGVEL